MNVPLVPRQVLFGNPERVSPRISPDGKRLAWIAPDEGVLNVWINDVGAPLTEARAVTADRDRGIRSFFWAHDNRHLMYIQDVGGDEDWRLFDVDLQTRDLRDLTPFEGVQARIEEADKRFPHHILVGLNKDNPQLHDVYRLDLRDGKLEKVVENPGFIGFLADADFEVRAGVAPRPDGGLILMVREPGDTVGGAEPEWRPLLQVGQDDALTTNPVAFTLDGRALWMVSSVGANAGRLVRLDCATGASDVVAEDPRYDVGNVRLHPDTREPQAVVYVKERAAYRCSTRTSPVTSTPCRRWTRAI